MKPSATTLVLTALLLVPVTGRASAMDDSACEPSDRVQQAEATHPPAAGDAAAVAEPPHTTGPTETNGTTSSVVLERHTGFGTLFRDLGGDFAHVPSRDSLLVGAVGGAAAIAVHPFDVTFNQRLEKTSVFGAGDRLGNTFTLMGATFAVYGVGLATGQSRVSHVAMDIVRAQVVSEVMVQSLKVATRRGRPDGSSGFSFPSGHAAVTLATATVLERHHGIKWALPAYGLAAYVAASRLHDNVHYVSDVVFGAAVGTIAGRTVTRHGRSNFAMMPLIMPGGGGFVIVR